MQTVEKLAYFGLAAALIGFIIANPDGDVKILNSLFTGYIGIQHAIQMR